jgi:hypothetical protein
MVTGGRLSREGRDLTILRQRSRRLSARAHERTPSARPVWRSSVACATGAEPQRIPAGIGREKEPVGPRLPHLRRHARARGLGALQRAEPGAAVNVNKRCSKLPPPRRPGPSGRRSWQTPRRARALRSCAEPRLSTLDLTGGRRSEPGPAAWSAGRLRRGCRRCGLRCSGSTAWVANDYRKHG